MQQKYCLATIDIQGEILKYYYKYTPFYEFEKANQQTIGRYLLK